MQNDETSSGKSSWKSDRRWRSFGMKVCLLVVALFAAIFAGIRYHKQQIINQWHNEVAISKKLERLGGGVNWVETNDNWKWLFEDDEQQYLRRIGYVAMRGYNPIDNFANETCSLLRELKSLRLLTVIRGRHLNIPEEHRLQSDRLSHELPHITILSL